MAIALLCPRALSRPLLPFQQIYAPFDTLLTSFFTTTGLSFSGADKKVQRLQRCGFKDARSFADLAAASIATCAHTLDSPFKVAAGDFDGVVKKGELVRLGFIKSARSAITVMGGVPDLTTNFQLRIEQLVV